MELRKLNDLFFFLPTIFIGHNGYSWIWYIAWLKWEFIIGDE